MKRVKSGAKGLDVAFRKIPHDGAHGIDIGLIYSSDTWLWVAMTCWVVFKKTLCHIEDSGPKRPGVSLVIRFGLKLQAVKERLHVALVMSLVTGDLAVKTDLPALDPNFKYFCKAALTPTAGTCSIRKSWVKVANCSSKLTDRFMTKVPVSKGRPVIFTVAGNATFSFSLLLMFWTAISTWFDSKSIGGVA